MAPCCHTRAKSRWSHRGAGRQPVGVGPVVAPLGSRPKFVAMRRGSWFRSLAAVVQLWLVVVLLGHGMIYTCPEHDGVPTAMASRGAPVAHHHATSAGDPRGSRASDLHREHACGCLCPGDCAGGTSSWLPTRAGVPAPPRPGRLALGASQPIVVLRPLHEHLLPFSNGPPKPLSA